jgi:hypothetical protein
LLSQVLQIQSRKRVLLEKGKHVSESCLAANITETDKKNKIYSVLRSEDGSSRVTVRQISRQLSLFRTLSLADRTSDYCLKKIPNHSPAVQVKFFQTNGTAVNVPMAATVESPFSVDVHQISPISKPRPAQATCKYARTRSGSMVLWTTSIVDLLNEEYYCRFRKECMRKKCL